MKNFTFPPEWITYSFSITAVFLFFTLLSGFGAYLYITSRRAKQFHKICRRTLLVSILTSVLITARVVHNGFTPDRLFAIHMVLVVMFALVAISQYRFSVRKYLYVTSVTKRRSFFGYHGLRGLALAILFGLVFYTGELLLLKFK